MKRLVNRRTDLVGVFLGLFVFAVALGILFWNLQLIRNLLAGPQPITVAELRQLENLDRLDNPWVTVTVDRVKDTKLFKETRNGQTVKRTEFLLLQVQDRWLLAAVPMNHRGGTTVTGSLTVWKASPFEDQLGEIRTQLGPAQKDLLPFQMNVGTEYQTDGLLLILLVGLMGVGGLVATGAAWFRYVRLGRAQTQEIDNTEKQSQPRWRPQRDAENVSPPQPRRRRSRKEEENDP
jgi:hypothetical protein